MLGLLFGKLIASPIIGTLLSSFGNMFLTYQKQKLDAQGSHEAVVAGLAAKSMDLDQREAELNAQIIVAEQGNWYTRSVRPTIAWIVILLLAKILIYDKALGQWTGGHTDPLGGDIWSVVKTVIVAYFGGRTIERVTDKVTSLFKK